jgi:hypothetical protein
MGKRVKVDQERSNGDVVVQLATRIPKGLYRQLKLHCVGESISIADFVSAAIGLALGRQASQGQQKRAS